MSAAADVIGQPFHIFSCTGTEGVPSRVVQARASNHFTPDSPRPHFQPKVSALFEIYRIWSTVGALRIMWRDRSHMSAAADVIGQPFHRASRANANSCLTPSLRTASPEHRSSASVLCGSFAFDWYSCCFSALASFCTAVVCSESSLSKSSAS